jgi:hypothetical protein
LAEERADERYCRALHALYKQYGDKAITQPEWHDTFFTWAYIRTQYFVVRHLGGILRWECSLIDAGYKPPGTLPSDVIRAKWTTKECKPIKNAVRDAEGLREKGNQ